MKWSKIKKMFEERLHQSVQGRLEFQFARYRHFHDEGSTTMRIVFDKNVVALGASLPAIFAQYEEANKLLEQHPDYNTGKMMWVTPEMREESEQIVEEQGVICSDKIYFLMKNYFNLSIEEAVNHEEGIVRAFAIVDKRFGQRQFDKLDIEKDNHPLVKLFYEIRKAT